VNINKDAESDPGVKTAAAAWFKRMEEGDEDALKNWRVWRELSVKKYAEEYERLNVHFDVYTGESKVGKKWQDFALERLEEMGLISDVEGAKLVDLEKWKLGKAVLRKKGTFVPFVVSPVSHPCLDDSDGTSIYLTRDIGGAIERYEQHKFDKMLYVISSQQDLHTAQFIKILHLMEFPWASAIEHVNYGLVLGMSTRKGTVVFLEQIIREAASVMHEQMKKNQEKYAAVEDPEQTSLEVGLAAIKIQDMAAKRCATSSLSLCCHTDRTLAGFRINNYTFNWDRMTSFEGDTGPYLQYAHVRLTSLTRKNPELLPLPPPDQIAAETLAEQPAAREIVFLLGTYPDVVRTALRTHEPSGVVTFAFRLAHAISSAWETVVVKGEADVERARARMWLYLCARDVLGAAMRLLSIRPLERM
jgi:arginyl-tRNA synthetase